MDTHDSLLNQILSDIRHCEDDKRKTQREIDTLNHDIENLRRQLDKPTRELEHYRKEMNELDRKFTTLHQQEKQRRDELAREQHAQK